MGQPIRAEIMVDRKYAQINPLNSRWIGLETCACERFDLRLVIFPGEDPHHQQQQQQTSYTYTISCTGGQLQGGHQQYRHVQAHVPLDPLDTGGYVSQQQHVAGPGPGYMEGARHTPPPPYSHGPQYSSSFSPCSSSSSLSPPITVSTRYISNKFIHCCF